MAAVPGVELRRESWSVDAEFSELEFSAPVDNLQSVEVRQQIVDGKIDDGAANAGIAQHLVERQGGQAARIDAIGAVTVRSQVCQVDVAVDSRGHAGCNIRPDGAGQGAIRLCAQQLP